MPSHKIHRLIDKLVLGKEMEHVHLIKDAPYKIFPGKKHREWFHDRTTNLILGIFFGPEAFIAGELHDWADNTFVEINGKIKVRPSKKKAKRGEEGSKHTTQNHK